MATGCSIGEPRPATDVVHTSAKFNGVVYSNQEDVDVQYWFRYGTSTAYGSTTPERTLHIPADSTDDRPHPVSEWVDGLEPDTTYHYQICTAPPRNGCVQSDQTFGTLAESPFVERSGESLTLEGDPYRFTGLNIYNANSRGECWYAMSDGSVLDEALDAIGPGKEAFRSWFFESLATTNGERDWSGFDHTLSVARSHGVKVIATLTNQWGDCEDGTYKDEGWYAGGYASYRDWVAEVVARYRNEPAILAWQLVNEAEVKPSRDAAQCSEGAAETLEAFAADLSAVVKSIDPNHLVSLGTIGGGQCGTQNAEYQDVHEVSTVDLCEYHDYQPGAIPGDQFNGLQVRIDQCAELDKPLIIGEAGIRPSDVGGTLQDRADAFDAKLAARAAAGVDGELVWAWSSLGSTLTDFDVGPDDPLLDVLAGY